MAIRNFVKRLGALAILPKPIAGKKRTINFMKYPTGTTTGDLKKLSKVNRSNRRDGRVYSHEHGI